MAYTTPVRASTLKNTSISRSLNARTLGLNVETDFATTHNAGLSILDIAMDGKFKVLTDQMSDIQGRGRRTTITDFFAQDSEVSWADLFEGSLTQIRQCLFVYNGQSENPGTFSKISGFMPMFPIFLEL